MLDEQVIIRGNEIIGNFVELYKNPIYPDGFSTPRYYFYDGWYSGNIKELKFHLSWDWLIPVVEKIEKIDNIYFQIEENSCYVYDISTFTDDHQNAFIIKDGNTKLEAVWLSVVEFIKWYNKNKDLYD